MAKKQKASGRVAQVQADRVIRIFVSSTFRDFNQERELLVRETFAKLRRRARERDVELVDIDLRWGITPEQSETGKVLPICLAEIDRCRPYFIGLLGERYGWVPTAQQFPDGLINQERWLAEHVGGKSVTELEILHGVLNNPAMAGRALFYFRDPQWSIKQGGDFVSANAQERDKLSDLKDRIRASAFPLVPKYASPQAVADRIYDDLWKLIDAEFPAGELPSAFEQETRRHNVYARSRLGVYVGAEDALRELGLHVQRAKTGAKVVQKTGAKSGAKGNATTDHISASRVTVVTGESGSGKTALIANWLHERAIVKGKANANDLVFQHHLGASSDAADPERLARRMLEWIWRVVEPEAAAKAEAEGIQSTQGKKQFPADKQELFQIIPEWLARASSYATMHNKNFVIVLDALDKLTGERRMGWLPKFIPEGVQLVLTTLAGEPMDVLAERGWTKSAIVIAPLTRKVRRDLIISTLQRAGKALTAAQRDRILAHPLSGRPIFLRTLLEELRVFGSHEQLTAHIDMLLTAQTVDDIFERVLERIEMDVGAARVKRAMVGLWSSRHGLSDTEVATMCNVSLMDWAAIRLRLDDALYDDAGRSKCAHDYLRKAIQDRYLPSQKNQRGAHYKAAQWWSAQEVDARMISELPWQWYTAQAWQELRACLTDARTGPSAITQIAVLELWSFWLGVEDQCGVRVEEQLEKVFPESLTNLNEGDLNCCLAVSSLLTQAGRYGKFHSQLLLGVLSISEKLFGLNHQYVGESLNFLAMLYSAQSDYAKAEPMYVRALAIYEKALDTNDPAVTSILNNLAMLYYEQRDYAKAEPMYFRALAIYERALVKDQLGVATILNNLAMLYYEQRDYTKAEPMYFRALAIYENVLGKDHPLVAGSTHNLASLYLVQREFGKALPLYLRATAIDEKALGKDHPYLTRSLTGLAGLFCDQGEFGKALPLYLRAIAIDEKAFGKDHSYVARRLNNLASLFYSLGDYAKALPMYVRALAIKEKALGKNHLEVAISLNNLAAVYSAQGKYAKALPRNVRALSISEKALGRDHPDVAISLNNLAAVYREQCNFGKALPLFKRALAINEKALGKDDPNYAKNLGNLAQFYYAQRDFKNALPLFERALVIHENALGGDHPDVATSLNNLAGLYQAQGDNANAIPLRERALVIEENTFGKDHPGVANGLNSLAGLYQVQGDNAKAIPLRERALIIQEKILGKDHPDVATSLNSLAKLYFKQGEYEIALPMCVRALAICEKALSNDHPDVATSLNNLAKLYFKQGEYETALPMFVRVLVIYQKAIGKNHPYVGISLNNYADCLEALGKTKEAAAARARAKKIQDRIDRKSGK
jgi:tetratricopeptide (TPR) repeat protein